jgi:hypothetical protein
VARKQKKIDEIQIRRLERAKLSAEESLKRMEEFPKRREKFIASIRKGKRSSLCLTARGVRLE